MVNCDQRISELKGEGKSLREIAVALGISHMAVSRKLKRMGVTETKGVTDKSSCNNPCNTLAKPHKSRVSGDFKGTVNRAVTQNTPFMDTKGGVTPSTNAVGMRSRHSGGCFEGFSGSLVEEIREYLENRGIRMYPLKVEMEAYQVEHDGETLRIYVKRKTEKE